MKSASRLLLIGWDGADWEFLSPMLDRGELPALGRVVDGGVIGNLSTLAPCLSPLLWTSIATGQTADRHGILGFVEPTPDGAGVRRVASTSRRSPAFWNIAGLRGLRSIVVGWYASHPAEPVNGVVVSEEFLATPTRPLESFGPPPEGSVWPPEKHAALAELRLHPAELSGDDLLPLIPGLAEIDVGRDRRPFRLAEVLARDLSTQAVATALMADEPWDCAAAFFPGLDTAGHYFMPFHPPIRPGVPEREFAHYQGVMTGLYRLYDQMLATLLQIAGDDARVMIVSDHGFQSGSRRPAWVGSDRALDPHAADWHRPLGVLAMKGPGLLADERVYGATLLDVAPTALALLGLPADQSMPGRVLFEAFPDLPVPARIADWNAEPWLPERRRAEAATDPAVAAAAVMQLVALGYLPAPPEDAAAAVRLAIRESRFNLAAVHQHHGRAAEALPVLAALRESEGDAPRLLMALARCHIQIGQPLEGLAVLSTLADDSVEIRLLRAAALHALGRAAEVRDELAKARAIAPENPEVWRMVGEQSIAVGDWTAAESAFARALRIDPDQAVARHGAGACCLKRNAFEEASGHLRAALGLRYFFPAAHYHLAVATLRLGDPESALASLRVAMDQAPEFVEAHDLAIEIEQARGRFLEAAALRQARDAAVTKKAKTPR